MELFKSELLTGFRENHNTQHSSLKILENSEEALYQGNSVSAILMITQFVLTPKLLVPQSMTY